jgi:phosphoribosylaminoimidazolecarboxamide formyltransferase/IMP cyclohydrolase
MPDFSNLKFPTKNKISQEKIADLKLAWSIVKSVKSNAIVVVKNGALISANGGQTSRVEAMENALRKGGENARGAVLASDAFFPFADSIDLAGKFGISEIIQPGGSIRDEEVISKADELGIAMAFTNLRSFLH